MNFACTAFWRPVLGMILMVLLVGNTVWGAAVPVNLVQDVTYKTTTEGELRLDLYYPEKELKGEYPVVLYTHGGGWTTGDKKGIWQGMKGEVTRGLNEKGFCVVAVQYRLWKKDGNTTMRDCVIDAKDALRFLARHRAQWHVNTDQVFTFGDSAGGQMAQMLLLSPPESLTGDPGLAGFSYRTIAGVSWYGPSDFEDPELFNPDGRPGFRDRFGARILPPGTGPEKKVALYREMSPVQYLKKDSPPLLLIQGDQDTTIPVHHAHHMKKRADALGAPVEGLIIQGAGHNWRVAEGASTITPPADVIVQSTIRFLADRLPGRAKEARFNGRLPDFSWETLPRYMHVRKASAFTSEEIAYLATFPLITFEKTTGSQTYGSTEAGTIEAARAIKTIHPSSKILFYRNVIVHYPGYAFDEALDSIPRWNLTGRNGKEELVRGRVKAYDLTQNRLRQWWTDSAASVCSDPAIDGLFLDGNVKVLSSYLKRELPDGKKEALMESYHQMIRATRRALGPDKLMLANLLRASLDDGGLASLPAFDGSYLEGFEHPVGGVEKVEYLARGIEVVQQAARQGKIIAMTLNIGESSLSEGVDERRENPASAFVIPQERLDYCIALFLIVAEEHSYLLVHDGYDANPSRTGEMANRLWMRDLPEFHKPLGPPKGPAARRGNQYTREFEHASVRLDIRNQRGTVTWK